MEIFWFLTFFASFTKIALALMEDSSKQIQLTQLNGNDLANLTNLPATKFYPLDFWIEAAKQLILEPPKFQRDPFIIPIPLIFNYELPFGLATSETYAYKVALRGLSHGERVTYQFNKTSSQFNLDYIFPKIQFDGIYYMSSNYICLYPWPCKYQFKGSGDYLAVIENFQFSMQMDFTFGKRVRAINTELNVQFDKDKARVFATDFEYNGKKTENWEELSRKWSENLLNAFQLEKGYLEESIIYVFNMGSLYHEMTKQEFLNSCQNHNITTVN